MGLLTALYVALLMTHVFASPVTISLQKIQRSGAYLWGSPAADRARATFLKDRAAGGPVTVPATNLAYSQYTTSVGIGSPPTYYNLIVDIHSSNTLCGTGTPYVRTHTSIRTGQHVKVTHGSGYFSGLEYLDQVTLAHNLVITNQSIGGAHSYANFFDVDGILGLGSVGLTEGTLSPDTSATIPTVMNNLVSQGVIKDSVLGIYFAPSTSKDDKNGALTYGGVDSSLFVGDLMYAPMTTAYPAANYFGLDIGSAAYGEHVSIIPGQTPGIVDTSTSLILLATDFFAPYVVSIPGATFDSKTGLLEIPPSSVDQMVPLYFWIGGNRYVMDVTAQLIPQDQNTAWGGDAKMRYGTVSDLGRYSGVGLDFILGQKFLERFYTAIDVDAGRIGFALTHNTFTTRV